MSGLGDCSSRMMKRDGHPHDSEFQGVMQLVQLVPKLGRARVARGVTF